MCWRRRTYQDLGGPVDLSSRKKQVICLATEPYWMVVQYNCKCSKVGARLELTIAISSTSILTRMLISDRHDASSKKSSLLP